MGVQDGFVVDRPIGFDSADNGYSSALVTADADGTLIERAEYIQQGVDALQAVVNGDALIYGGPNYLRVPITFAALTTGAVGTHEIFTVTGLVRVRLIVECTVNVAGGGSIQLGVEGVTNGFIAVTTGTDLDAGEVWCDATPAETYGNFSTLVLDKVVNGLDIGYEVSVDTLTGGALVFHCFYEPLNNTGAVVVSDGLGGL